MASYCMTCATKSGESLGMLHKSKKLSAKAYYGLAKLSLYVTTLSLLTRENFNLLVFFSLLLLEASSNYICRFKCLLYIRGLLA